MSRPSYIPTGTEHVHIAATEKARSAKSCLISNAYLQLAEEARYTMHARWPNQEFWAATPRPSPALLIVVSEVPPDDMPQELFDITDTYDPFGIRYQGVPTPRAQNLGSNRMMTGATELFGYHSRYLSAVLSTLNCAKFFAGSNHTTQEAESLAGRFAARTAASRDLHTVALSRRAATAGDFCGAASPKDSCCSGHALDAALLRAASALSQTARSVRAEMHPVSHDGSYILRLSDGDGRLWYPMTWTTYEIAKDLESCPHLRWFWSDLNQASPHTAAAMSLQAGPIPDHLTALAETAADSARYVYGPAA